MKIWLDDIRPSPFPHDPKRHWGGENYPYDHQAPYDVHCGNAHDALILIEAEVVTFISFDHDLGQGGTGYDVAKRIEELAYLGQLDPIQYKVHSANPVGAGNIIKAMESAWKVWNKKQKE